MHHSTRDDREMDNAMDKFLSSPEGKANGEAPAGTQLGPTGMFPEGKLTKQDEGETAFRIGTVEGKVVLQFGAPTRWVGMSPEQAIALSKILYKRGKKLIRSQSRIIRPGEG